MASATYEVRVGYLYPEWLNLYGDRGNVLVLQRRCQWRGIACRVVEITLEQAFTGFAQLDIVLLGGGSDDAQRAIAEDLLREKGPALKEEVERGLVVLAVCGGYQQLGHYYRTAAGVEIPGVGLLDLYTEAGSGRLVGDVVAQMQPVELRGVSLVGYENHSGRTHLGPSVRPLARVVIGHGNNGEDHFEGAVYKNVFGTYVHGPLLPKNPAFADHLLTLALRRRYGAQAPKLALLDDRLERLAHEQRMRLEHRRGFMGRLFSRRP